MEADEWSYPGLEILRVLEDARNYNALLVRLIEINVKGARRLLDFGAGVGTFSRLLRTRGHEVICVEPNPRLAEVLEQAGFETHPDLASLQAGALDFAFSLNVFEHIADDSEALGGLASKVASGGTIFLYVPAFQWLWTSLDDKVKHERRYTRRTLTQLVSSQGLKVIATGYADCLGIGAALFFRLFGNKEGRLSSAGVRAYDRLLMPVSVALDRIFNPFLGKNVWIVCRKP